MSDAANESMASMLSRISNDATGEKPSHAMMWSVDAAKLAGIQDPDHPWLASPEWIALSGDGQ